MEQIIFYLSQFFNIKIILTYKILIKIHMDELKNQHLYSPKAHENKALNLIENEKEKENQNIIS